MTAETSRSLLVKARHNEPEAWSRLIDLYSPLVGAWCRLSNVNEQDIGDLVQEIFTAVARSLDRFRKEQPDDTFRGWLRTITQNKVRDYYRRRAGEPTAAGGTEAFLRLAQVVDPLGVDDEERVSAEDPAFAEVIERALTSIRGEFEPRTWQAFWSVVVEGRTAAEAATELKMQPGNVRVAKSRVLVRLRRELGDVWQ